MFYSGVCGQEAQINYFSHRLFSPFHHRTIQCKAVEVPNLDSFALDGAMIKGTMQSLVVSGERVLSPETANDCNSTRDESEP